MEGPPYRTMPLPPGPPREWRPIVERCLAAFNALAFAGVVCTRWLPTPDAAVLTCTAGAVFLAAVFGLAGRGPRRLRAWLTVPSGVSLFCAGLGQPLGVVVQHAYARRQNPPTPMPWTGPLLATIVLVTLGVLTLESAFARLRAARGAAA